MTELGQPLATGRTAEIYAWDNGTVLKLYREWCPPHWVEREAQVARAVTQAGLSTPRAGATVEVAGRRGLVYERVHGISMVEGFNRQPWRIATLSRTLADLHLEMHQLSLPELPTQRPGLERAIRSAPNLSDDLRDAVLQSLERLPQGDRLCHGDFHPNNVLLTAKGPLVIDWMTASRGNAWADVARTLVIIQVGGLPENPLALRLMQRIHRLVYDAYLQRYQAALPDDDGQLRAWLPIQAAVRLNEEIPGEAPRLLQMVRAAFA